MDPDYINQISLTLAVSAHRGTSFVPEIRGEQERTDYANTLQVDYAVLKEGLEPEKLAALDEEFARYSAGYLKRKLAHLHAKSRCISTMITGGSNFPVKRANKANDSEHKRLVEIIEYRKRALSAIRKRLYPEQGPILGNNPDAPELLHQKIAQAEQLQITMKAANKIIRSAPECQKTAEKIASLVAIGIKEGVANELFVADFGNRIGFADYETRNNGANIRRMKDRLAQLEHKRECPASSRLEDGYRVDECPDEDRIRISFAGKPVQRIINALKQNGFKWSRSNDAWQRNLNQAGRWAVERVEKILSEKIEAQDGPT